MTNHVVIRASDKATSEAVRQALADHGIIVRRITPNQALQFGMKISAGKVSVEGSPEEFLYLDKAGPEMVDAFFDTLERFIDRVKLFVNGQSKEIPTKGSLKRRPSFEEFTRGL